jgi:hypothetical protein
MSTQRPCSTKQKRSASESLRISPFDLPQELAAAGLASLAGLALFK